MPRHARDRLLETAERLFYAEGLHAVGIERILAESSVGRASFYRHFPSKDDLIVAVLRCRDERWRRWLDDAVTKRGGQPLAVFDALAERFDRDDFRGCAFINTMVEIADGDHDAHRVAAEHKQKVLLLLRSLLADAGVTKPAELAKAFLLLMDGAIVTAIRERKPGSAKAAKKIAASLLSTYRLQEN